MLDPPANNQGYYDADPNFPIDPNQTNLVPILNIGPDADKFRNANTGAVYDASNLGMTINGISDHKSPTSLFFDKNNELPGGISGTGLLTNWTPTSSLYMYDIGADLLSIKLLSGNQMSVNRLVSGFTNPMDVVILNGEAYLLDKNRIWRIKFQENTLPVALMSFDSSVENCEVSLSWKSSDEQSFKHYLLERSYDARNFSAISEVKGIYPEGGNYSFTENLDNQNTSVYYRLKMVDADGSFTYSAIIGEYLNCSQLKFYPNPVKNEIIIENLNSWNSIMIFDSNGKMVYDGKPNSSKIDISFLPEGNYTMKLLDEITAKHVSWRFIKM